MPGMLSIDLAAFSLAGASTGGLDDEAIAMMDGLSLYRWASPSTRHWWNDQCGDFIRKTDNAWFWRSLWNTKLEVFGLSISLPSDKTNYAHYPWSLNDQEFVAAYKSLNDGKDPGLGDEDLRVAKQLRRIGSVAGVAGKVISFVAPEIGGPVKAVGSVAAGVGTAIPYLHNFTNNANVAVLKGRYAADARRRTMSYA